MTVLLLRCVLLLLASTVFWPTVSLPVTVTVSLSTITSAVSASLPLLVLICWLLV